MEKQQSVETEEKIRRLKAVVWDKDGVLTEEGGPFSSNVCVALENLQKRGVINILNTGITRKTTGAVPPCFGVKIFEFGGLVELADGSVLNLLEGTNIASARDVLRNQLNLLVGEYLPIRNNSVLYSGIANKTLRIRFRPEAEAVIACQIRVLDRDNSLLIPSPEIFLILEKNISKLLANQGIENIEPVYTRSKTAGVIILIKKGLNKGTVLKQLSQSGIIPDLFYNAVVGDNWFVDTPMFNTVQNAGGLTVSTNKSQINIADLFYDSLPPFGALEFINKILEVKK